MDRPDGLPHPATVDQIYLAAILDELRASRKGGPQLHVDTFHVKEIALSVAAELKKNRVR